MPIPVSSAAISAKMTAAIVTYTKYASKKVGTHAAPVKPHFGFDRGPTPPRTAQIDVASSV